MIVPLGLCGCTDIVEIVENVELICADCYIDNNVAMSYNIEGEKKEVSCCSLLVYNR